MAKCVIVKRKQPKQCPATYRLPNGETAEYGCHTFSCVVKGEHTQHFDHAGTWLVDGERKRIVSIVEANREMNIAP